jgi:formylglycine-generating enzyme required for sulfatase activity
LNYNEATQYCRWLSGEHGFPAEQWCYPEDYWRDDGTSPKVEPCSDYLEREGYRLPTEEEWECATRAGATTCRFYGGSAGLLKHYAHYRFTSEGPRPVGLLKPNDLGLFDVYGNVGEWCEWGSDGDKDPDVYAMYRGGSCRGTEPAIRSACRRYLAYVQKGEHTGFRIARTISIAGDPEQKGASK